MTCISITTESARFNDAKVLLESYNLDTSDLVDSQVALWAWDESDRLAGVIGLERSEGIGLLRSLAVSENHQGKGIAKKLCEVVFEQARLTGITDLYLLTETASTFFEGQGFKEIARDQAPASLKLTRQFSALCPDSATVMARASEPEAEVHTMSVLT